VAVEGGQILLVRRSSPPESGLWALPAVEVAADEPLVVAAVRAVEEGAGLEAVCARMLGHVEHFARDCHRVLLAFEATVLSDPRPASPARWVPVDEVTDLQLTAGLPELLADRGIIRLIV